MTVNIVVPSLGESVSEVRIAELNNKIGDFVQKDQIIGELETDKATLEISSEHSGYITQLNAQKGDTLKVGDIIAVLRISEQVESAIAKNTASVSSVKTPAVTAMPPAPSVAKMVDSMSINIDGINGSGKRGQVLKEDILHLTKEAKPLSSDHQMSKKEEIVKMSKIRQTIASRLKFAQNTAAILTTFNEVDMSAVMDLRKQCQEAFEKKHSVKLGFMSFFAKASVVALMENPSLNASIRDNDIVFKNYYHIGVAVGTDKGLFVPVIKHVEGMSFAAIERQIKAFGEKAKEGKLALDDMKDGTFTISNGGVYGSMMSTPILNPPQSGILGLHNIIRRPIAVGEEVVIRPMMYIALSYDHRLVDGKEAVTFLARIKQLIETPQRLMFDI